VKNEDRRASSLVATLGKALNRYLWVVILVVTGGSLTRRPKRSLRCLLVEMHWQIN